MPNANTTIQLLRRIALGSAKAHLTIDWDGAEFSYTVQSHETTVADLHRMFREHRSSVDPTETEPAEPSPYTKISELIGLIKSLELDYPSKSIQIVVDFGTGKFTWKTVIANLPPQSWPNTVPRE